MTIIVESFFVNPTTGTQINTGSMGEYTNTPTGQKSGKDEAERIAKALGGEIETCPSQTENKTDFEFQIRCGEHHIATIKQHLRN